MKQNITKKQGDYFAHVLALDGIIYDSRSRLTFTSESHCLRLLHFNPQGLLMGFFGNMTILEPPVLEPPLWHVISFFFVFLLFKILFLVFPLLPSPVIFLFLSPSCLFCLSVCCGGEQLSTEKKKNATNWNHYSNVTRVINGEQRTGCSLRIHFFASRMLLLFPSCDIYFFWGTSTWELQVWDQWWE